MRTVMIVDDERPARELLKITIDWEKAGFQIIAEARNGKQALKEYEKKKPDLIITDVQMPVMDGLLFLEKVKSICPDQKVVILSCHEDFSYARRALQLGVMDYLIKDALTDECLYQLLEEVKSAGGSAAPSNPPNAGALSIRLLSDILSGIPQQKQLAFSLLKSYTEQEYQFFCCLCCPEGFSGSSSEWEDLSEEFRSCISQSLFADTTVYRHHYLLVLCLIKRRHSQMELSNSRFQSLRLIRKELELLTGCTVSIGVSNPSSDIERLEPLIEESFLALKSKVFQGIGKTLYYNPQYNKSQSLQVAALNSQLQQIRSSADNSDPASLEKSLQQIYGKGLDGITHYHYLNYVNAILLDILMDNCQKRRVSYETVFGSETLRLDIFDRMDSPQALLQWFLECFTRLFQASSADSSSYSVRIRKIVEYIQDHFQQDISLETVADSFWIHKVYLAKIFKQETGKSVNEYIRCLRIEKAKEMLADENVRINDIVTAAGFNNPQSFYTIFKKYVGMKPKEYRERL